MKITKLLLWFSYISFAGSLCTILFLGNFFLEKDFNNQEGEKESLAGVVSKSTTSKFELPMNLNVEYYFRIKNGELLVDSYFLKIQKKLLTNVAQGQNVKNSEDYPLPLQENLYAMPDTETYLYIPIPFSSIKAAITIFKFYFLLVSISLLAAIFLIIRFLQNCNKGNFFIQSNITYIRMISYLAIGYSLMEYGIQWIIFQTLNNSFSELAPINIDSALDFNWTFLIASLFIALIAQAFTEGIKLKEEQSLTI
jgi:hypothetical protein